jgi:hypothetical protein
MKREAAMNSDERQKRNDGLTPHVVANAQVLC